MITRGTTPYYTFDLPFGMDNIDNLFITYLQNKEIILDKELGTDGVSLETSEESPDSSKLNVHLTQEETLKFNFYPAAEKNIAVVQIRVLDKDGEAYALPPKRERVYGVLKNEVISTKKEESNE